MENNAKTVNNELEEDDKHPNVERLLAQIVELKSEKQKSLEEFGAQRGKMKELYLQREEERNKLKDEINTLRKDLDDSRSQVTMQQLETEAKENERLKAQDELTSLQQLLTATLEESSRYEEEIHALRCKNGDLENELSSLKSSPHHQHHSTSQPTIGSTGGGNQSTDSSVLGNPGMMFTSLARKVASQLGGTDSAQHNHATVENLEESARKAKEDAELLRSLLVPLEEEIAVLKSKLRETAEQLQKYQAREARVLNKVSRDRGDDVEDGGNEENGEEQRKSKSAVCDMCMNYEDQLVQAQAQISELERQLSVMERYKEELAKETVFRKQIEEKWAESKEEHKTQVAELQNKLKLNETTVAKVKQKFSEMCEDVKKQFTLLSDERKKVQERLIRIQHENESLAGKYTATSQSLQNDQIDLPHNVEKLQEMWLTQREDLIRVKVGLDRSDDIIKNLETVCAGSQEKQEELTTRISELEHEVARRDNFLMQDKNALKKIKHDKDSLDQRVKDLVTEVEGLKTDKKRLEESESELRNRLCSFQTGLENGEAVQKDFVMLSQSLQKELERLRSQNNSLRWEHEEDVAECRGCEQPFKSKKKINCRHCGRIFCMSCLSHKVTSGPNQRESRVCQVCHTLLNSQTAPYFSTEPPHQK